MAEARFGVVGAAVATCLAVLIAVAGQRGVRPLAEPGARGGTDCDEVLATVLVSNAKLVAIALPARVQATATQPCT